MPQLDVHLVGREGLRLFEQHVRRDQGEAGLVHRHGAAPVNGVPRRAPIVLSSFARARSPEHTKRVVGARISTEQPNAGKPTHKLT